MRQKNDTASAKNAPKESTPGTDTAVMEVPTLDTPPAETPAAEPTVTMTQAQIDKMIENAIGRWAQNNPSTTSRQGGRDAELAVPDKVLDIPVDGRLEDVRRTDLILDSGGEPLIDGDSSKARELAFMEEYVDILVAESSNPNDQPVFQVSVNGRQIWILRGEVTRVKRHYADKLGRTRNEEVKVSAARNADGEVVNRTVKSNALAFPFSVVEDRNPLGKAWLAKLMKGH
jgi:hypothetical protein